MRHHALFGHSILRRPRSSRVSAIVRSGLAVVVAAGVCACHHSESGSSVLPGQVQWPLADVPAIAQRAVAHVRTKWQPDAFLTSI